MSLNLFKHLLPQAKAWNITAEKRLRQFFQGLANGLITPSKVYYDNIWDDIFPETTTQIPEWETSFGLAETSLTTQERRDRLDATWKALGGQSPRYIQDTLQNSGFDVFIHEWWEPNVFPFLAVYCGEVDAECGEAVAVCVNAIADVRSPLDVLAPDNITPVVGKGYPLVNKITESRPDLFAICGEALAQCGEPEAYSYNFSGFIYNDKPYFVTTDPTTWPYYLYLGGEVFGDLADVSADRRCELETLCLKICPTQLWLGMLINYV